MSVNIDKQAEDVANALRGYVQCSNCQGLGHAWNVDNSKPHLVWGKCVMCGGKRMIDPKTTGRFGVQG